MFFFVCRRFKLILHRNVDVLTSDFKAFVIDEENRQQSIDVESEFYHGFEECKFSSLCDCFCKSDILFQDIAILQS